jgi:hypothetical protein
MPKYAALIYGTEGEPQAPDSAEAKKVRDAYMSYTEDIQKAGILRGGEGLMPPWPRPCAFATARW